MLVLSDLVHCFHGIYTSICKHKMSVQVLMRVYGGDSLYMVTRDMCVMSAMLVWYGVVSGAREARVMT